MKKLDFKELINKQTLTIMKGCKVDPRVQKLKPYSSFQFERKGYFCIDPETTKDNLIINQTIELRDTWEKIQKQKRKDKK